MRRASPLLLLALLAPPARAADVPAGVQIVADGDGCPGRAELHDSLEARLPGVVREPGGPQPLIDLRLEPEAPPATGLRLALVDAAGAVVLERSLHRAAAPADGAACAALADTVALIVARFLREIGYQGPPARAPARAPGPVAIAATAPPAPAPPPPWSAFLGLGAAGRVGFGGTAGGPRAELTLTLGVGKGLLGAALTGGVAAETSTAISGTGGRFHLREYPLRALAGARFELGGGALLAGAALAASLLSFSSQGLPGAVSQHAVELGGEGACAYVRPLVGAVALRVAAAAGVVAAPRDFDVGTAAPVYGTPRAYLRLELGLGVAFGKFRDQPTH